MAVQFSSTKVLLKPDLEEFERQERQELEILQQLSTGNPGVPTPTPSGIPFGMKMFHWIFSASYSLLGSARVKNGGRKSKSKREVAFFLRKPEHSMR